MQPLPGKRKRTILTIGHSTRSFESFVELLNAHGVKLVADVRTIPRSRRNPSFNKETLPEELAKLQIGYVHLPGLGGLRHPRRDSPNAGWHNASFRGFADYMQTSEFESSLEDLVRMNEKGTFVIMCAEAVPWRCHRSLIADALLIRHIPVEHIMGLTNRRVHTLTPFARVDSTSMTYPETKKDILHA